MGHARVDGHLAKEMEGGGGWGGLDAVCYFAPTHETASCADFE